MFVIMQENCNYHLKLYVVHARYRNGHIESIIPAIWNNSELKIIGWSEALIRVLVEDGSSASGFEVPTRFEMMFECIKTEFVDEILAIKRTFVD